MVLIGRILTDHLLPFQSLHKGYSVLGFVAGGCGAVEHGGDNRLDWLPVLQIDHRLVREIVRFESTKKHFKPYPEAGVYASVIPQEYPPVEIVSKNTDPRLREDYSVFQGALRNTPLQKMRRKAHEALELEERGSTTAARETWIGILALAKLWKATSGEEYCGTSPLLVACSHFHLAKAYWAEGYGRQAINHASK